MRDKWKTTGRPTIRDHKEKDLSDIITAENIAHLTCSLFSLVLCGIDFFPVRASVLFFIFFSLRSVPQGPVTTSSTRKILYI